MRSPAAMLFLLAVVAAGAGATSALGFEKPPAVGVVMPADPRGPLLARFAVLVYNLDRNARLTYVGVSGVYERPDKAGVRYQMVVTAAAAGGGSTAKYRTVVWGVPETAQWMLLQFKRIN